MDLLTRISTLRQMLEQMAEVESPNPSEAGTKLQTFMLLRDSLVSLVEVMKLVLTAKQPFPDMYSAVGEECLQEWLRNQDKATTEVAMLIAEIRVLDEVISKMKADLWQDLASHQL